MSAQSVYINHKRTFAFLEKRELLDYINHKRKILIALNAEKLNNNDERLDEIINQNIGYPDGIGATLALRRKGFHSIKIAGAEFWLDIIERYSNSKSFYLIGSTDEVIHETVVKLKENYPNLDIVGYRNGYLNSEDKNKLILDFKEKQPDIIFVAMGSPRQEFSMKKFMEFYPALYMGLGGSFDVYSGLKKRAPKVFINFGLEWAYRLLKEPTRIKRQFRLLEFGFKILFNKI